MKRCELKLNWRQNPDDQNSYLAEFKTPHGDVRFEIISVMETLPGGQDALLWSYSYILPWAGFDFFDHYPNYDSIDEAKEAAESTAWQIHIGDE